MTALEYHTDVLAFWVLQGVFVVFYVARLGGVDGVVAAHGAVVAWEPFGAALAEDDVAGDHVLFYWKRLSVFCFRVSAEVGFVCVSAIARCRDPRGKKVVHAHVLS